MKKFMVYCILILILILIVLFCTKFLIQNDNKTKNPGNNKNIDEIERYFLNIESYKAIVDVTVISNKNENQYKMEQEVKKNYSKMIVKSPEVIANMEIIYENGVLQIKNTELNVSKVYNDYPYVSKNILFFTDFIKIYKESDSKKVEEYDDAIYMKAKNTTSKYNQNQILRINKQSLKPESLEIQDINNQTKVYILYNEIELNI